ncbi:MAG TPA: response regulator transcription factor [Anaerolineales bacterium]|nr:response regulator transcription factor [Anaerolineales bacterium]
MKVDNKEPRTMIIRVLVVDDHAIIRKGMRAVLDLVPDIELVGEAENGKQAVKMDLELRPDVILMDLMMPEMDGIACIREVKSKRPEARILVLTNFAGEDMIFPAIKAGAMGYHLKDSSPEALVEAIRQVHHGESSLHPLIAKKVLEELHAPSQQRLSNEPLTPRELEVLRLIAQGHENKEIAEHLVVSEATVRTHVSNILGKLHLASRTQAALYAIKEGLASLDDS